MLNCRKRRDRIEAAVAEVDCEDVVHDNFNATDFRTERDIDAGQRQLRLPHPQVLEQLAPAGAYVQDAGVVFVFRDLSLYKLEQLAMGIREPVRMERLPRIVVHAEMVERR